MTFQELIQVALKLGQKSGELVHRFLQRSHVGHVVTAHVAPEHHVTQQTEGILLRRQINQNQTDNETQALCYNNNTNNHSINNKLTIPDNIQLLYPSSSKLSKHCRDSFVRQTARATLEIVDASEMFGKDQ